VLPLAAALLGGILAATLVFSEIHGITIAFGATLIGVVDDYPMHLFSRARHLDARATVRSLWWTLLASAATTLIAYLTLIVAGSRGLAQLGVFCFAGIVCALAVTCWVLPRLMPPRDALPSEDPTPISVRLSLRAWLPTMLIATAALAVSGGAQWNDDLGALTPLPAELLRKDNDMRQRLGAPDVRYMVSIAGEARTVLAQSALVAALPTLRCRLGGLVPRRRLPRHRSRRRCQTTRPRRPGWLHPGAVPRRRVRTFSPTWRRLAVPTACHPPPARWPITSTRILHKTRTVGAPPYFSPALVSPRRCARGSRNATLAPS
jgi:predicted exporter